MHQEILKELSKCRNNPARFSTTVLGQDKPDGHGNQGLWSRQREICDSFARYPATYISTGNMIGKSRVSAVIILSYLLTHPNSLVLCTAPSATQLSEVLWKEVERLHKGSRIPLGGRLLRSPLKLDLGGGWQALGYATNSIERLSGHHGPDVAAILDEASGIPEPIWEAVAGVNPARLLAPGNPLWPHGTFYERCQQGCNELQNVIQVSSLESPHIHLERSPWGLADATWLAKSKNDYGETSTWYRTHVLGRFPLDDAEAVILGAWLDLAARTIHIPKGPRRLSVDLAEGNGGNRTVIGVRDDNGILHWEFSNRWSFEVTAQKVADLCFKFGIEHHYVSYDSGGPGFGFANSLASAGILGAKPYRGGVAPQSPDGKIKFENKRTLGAWRLRQRLDPNFKLRTTGGLYVPQTPFAIPPDVVAVLRRELTGLRYINGSGESIALESKEAFAKRLRCSPDHADCAGQLFGAWAA